MKLSRIGETSATTLTMKGLTVLFSYETPVAYFDHKTWAVFITDKKWSVTTSKHINAFVKEHQVQGHEPYHISQDMLDAMFANG